MGTVRRFGAALSSGKQFAPGKDYNYAKKVIQSGQNKYVAIDDIVQVWCHWVKDKEGKPKPIFCYGPDPESPLYRDEHDHPTGQGVCVVCQAAARMALSKDAKVVEMAVEMEARPVYATNVYDMDDPEWHDKNGGHARLLSTHEDSNFFGQGMASDMFQALVNYGTPDDPADYRTWGGGQGLMWVTTKTGGGKQTRYPTTAMPCPPGVMAKALGLTKYDLVGDVCAQTPIGKIEEWLGKNFLAQYGVTPDQIENARKFIKESDRKRDADEGVSAGSSAPTAAPPVSRPAAPPPTAAAPAAPPPTAPAPAAPPPPAPAAPPPAPPPPAPPNPAQEAVVGPDGAMLPPGVRWQKTPDGKPYFWHVSNTSKSSFAVADVAVPS